MFMAITHNYQQLRSIGAAFGSANQTAGLRILLETFSSAAKPRHLTVSLGVPCVSLSASAQLKIKISQPARLAVWLGGLDK